MEAVLKRIKKRLRALGAVVDRGMLIGTQERRDAKRLLLEIKQIMAELDRMDADRRVARKGEAHGES